MKLYKVSNCIDHFDPIHCDYGCFYKIGDCNLHSGYYLTKKDNIYVENIHENFNKKWLKYWLRERTNTFGGVNATDLNIVDNGDKIYLKNEKQNQVNINFDVYVFQYTYDHNFYHFLVSSLPRLYFFVKEKLNCKVLVHDETPNYQLDLVKYVIGEKSVYVYKKDSILHLDSAYLSPFPKYQPTEFLSRFYSDCFPLIEDSSRVLFKKVFLSRADAPDKRPVLNLTDFESLLKSYSFKFVIASNLSLLERISIFQNVRIIIGVFSAGFANMLFAVKCKYIIFIEHPLYGIPSEYIEFCKARNITLIVLKTGFYKKFTSLLTKRFIKSKINPNNSTGWCINLRKVKHILSKLNH